MTRLCRWRCHLCSAIGESATPIAAFWWHYKNTHQTTTTRVSIFDGVVGR